MFSGKCSWMNKTMEVSGYIVWPTISHIRVLVRIECALVNWLRPHVLIISAVMISEHIYKTQQCNRVQKFEKLVIIKICVFWRRWCEQTRYVSGIIVLSRTNGGLNLVLWQAKSPAFMAMFNITLKWQHYMTGLRNTQIIAIKRY